MGYSPWGCKESDMTKPVCTHIEFYNYHIQLVQSFISRVEDTALFPTKIKIHFYIKSMDLSW